ncbi:MAG: beta-glucosidase BglX [Pseudomonadota bacterium]|uniref:beta-glucosidase BglX n=1 Tax=Sphingomonas sp. ERG5 TaxID=1381597 RepID=UPI00054B6460|nr:beta-glucosidase BglX [Sphingomonas sp. ERG5]
MQLSRRALLQSGAMVAGLSLAPRVALAQSDRIESLIARMTLAEKAGQLSCFSDLLRAPGVVFNPGAASGNTAAQLANIRAGRVGMLFNGTGVAGGRAMQRMALEETRLGIPLIFGADVIHGLRTVFPIPLAEAGSFDLDLAERTARGAALESTALGIHWTFAPMVDVARDQRWGRVAEGSGEDTYLGQAMAAARVRGFQGKDLRDPTRMLACPKHFAAYGAVAAGMDYNSVDISMEALREIHFPPFQSSFAAGAVTAMSAFNDINGVPATANHWLLTDLLRGEWAFKGVVVSDWTADEELIAHGYAADGRDAAKKAFLAGVDMSMSSNLYNLHLPALVEAGEVPIAAVDASVRRVLHLKDMIGLFDNPYRSLDAKAERIQVTSPALRRLSRESGARSIVLLKNDGGLLPLKSNPGRIALIGPFGDDRDNVVGMWAFMAEKKINVDLASGIRAKLADPSQLDVVKGSDVEAALPGGIEAAVAAARAADVVLLAIGETQNMSGEAQSRTAIIVPPAQQALVEAVAATGKPVIVLLRHGRALALSGAVRDAPAILATWFLGSEAGNAIADVLFGTVNPSAKLPVSFPHDSGQEPYFYNHKSTGRPDSGTPDEQFRARYRETGNNALYPFGHGLSYTNFALSALQVGGPLTANGTLAVTATIANSGKVAGTEVVQLYIRDRVASRTRPVRELKRFERLTLAPGETKQVSFTLAAADLRFWAEGKWTIEPGAFDIWLGTSSVGGLKDSFELV